MIRKFKKYLESKDFDFDFDEEEYPLEGYYYWIRYNRTNKNIELSKIKIEYTFDKTYIYRNLLGKELTISETEFIENDLTTTEHEDDPEKYGIACLFTDLNSHRFIDLYTYYFKKRFDKKILKNMGKKGLIKTIKYKIEEPKNYGWGDYDSNPKYGSSGRYGFIEW